MPLTGQPVLTEQPPCAVPVLCAGDSGDEQDTFCLQGSYSSGRIQDVRAELCLQHETRTRNSRNKKRQEHICRVMILMLKQWSLLRLQIHPAPRGWLTTGFCCSNHPVWWLLHPLHGQGHVFHVQVKLCIQRDWSEVSESDLKGLSWGLLFYSDGNLPLVSQPRAQEQAQEMVWPSKTGLCLAHLHQLGVGWGWGTLKAILIADWAPKSFWPTSQK